MDFKPSFEALAQVTDYVEETLTSAGAPFKFVAQLNIAVDEVYSNIVQYSKADMSTVVCDIRDREATLTFTDNGTPYNPLENEDPDVTLSAEERKIGGLGIFMVKKIMDSVEYKYEDGENKLILKKNWQ